MVSGTYNPILSGTALPNIRAMASRLAVRLAELSQVQLSWKSPRRRGYVRALWERLRVIRSDTTILFIADLLR